MRIELLKTLLTCLTNICGCADIRLGIRLDSRYFPIQYSDVFFCDDGGGGSDDGDDGRETCRRTSKTSQSVKSVIFS